MPSLRSLFIDDHGAVRSGWRILQFILLLGVLNLAVAPLWPAPWRGQIPDRWIDMAVVLAATWLCLRTEGRPLADAGLRADGRFLRETALGALGGAAVMLATAGLIGALGGFHWVRTPGTGLRGLLAGASVYLAVAGFEELLFRGYPFQRAVRGLGFAGAQAVFAAAFVAAHWSNPGMTGATRIWAALNIALAGLLLGLCWRRTGSLALPIGVHLGWNWTQGTLLGFGVSGTEGAGWWTPVFHGRPEWLTGGAFGLEASAVCALVCGTAILGLWRWRGISGGGSSRASES